MGDVAISTLATTWDGHALQMAVDAAANMEIAEAVPTIALQAFASPHLDYVTRRHPHPLTAMKLPIATPQRPSPLEPFQLLELHPQPRQVRRLQHPLSDLEASHLTAPVETKAAVKT